MTITKQITQEKILDLVQKKGFIKSKELVNKFGVSRQYVSRLIFYLVRNKKLIKVGSTRSAVYTTLGYLQKNPNLIPKSYSKTLTNTNLEEHVVLNDIENNFLEFSRLPENIKSIFDYAFSEMFNNATDHSESKKIKFSVSLDKNILMFVVDDFGVGVFRNIMKKRKLKSEIEAIQDLLKGKFTTAPKLHSGEGIFFTSKVGDEFVLDSYGYQFLADNKIKDIFIKKTKGYKRGTRVTFSINLANKHHLNNIFKKYANLTEDSDYGFDRTDIRVRLYSMDGVHISRSQARRVLSGLEKFKIIVMDYDRVPTVGQAFVDEIYRVFKNKRPDIKIINENMGEAVAFMVGRGQHK